MEDNEMQCPTCGQIIKKEPRYIFSHGLMNPETGQYECHDPDEIEIPYTTAKKKGDSVEWTKDGKKINLN